MEQCYKMTKKITFFRLQNYVLLKAEALLKASAIYRMQSNPQLLLLDNSSAVNLFIYLVTKTNTPGAQLSPLYPPQATPGHQDLLSDF